MTPQTHPRKLVKAFAPASSDAIMYFSYLSLSFLSTCISNYENVNCAPYHIEISCRPETIVSEISN